MISDDQQGDRDRCPDCGAAPDEDHRTPHPLIPYSVPLTADEAARMDAEQAAREREPMPIFSIITTEGSWYRSFIEEADAANGIWVIDPRTHDEASPAYFDTDAMILIPWSEIQSITRDGEST